MKAPHDTRRIFELLDGELTARREKELRAHLESCEGCRRFYERAFALRDELLRLGSADPAGVDWARVDAAVERLGAPPAARPALARRLPGGWRSWLALAACLLLVVSYGVYRQWGAGRGGKAPAEAAEGEALGGIVTFASDGARWRTEKGAEAGLDLATPVTGRMHVETGAGAAAGLRLGASAGVRVEPSTRLFVERLTTKEIGLRLEEGTVSVDFSPERAGMALGVATPDARVVVRGTLFSVTRRGGVTSVTVARGSVEVGAPGDAVAGRVVRGGEGLDVRAGAAGTPAQAAQAAAERERLESAFFAAVPPGAPWAPVAVDARGAGAVAFVEIGGKREATVAFTVRLPEGAAVAAVVLADGTRLSGTFVAAAGKEPALVRFEPAGGAGGALAPIALETVEPPKAAQKKKPAAAAAEKQVAAVKAPEEEQDGGFIDPVVVKMVMMKHKGELRACYEKYLKRDHPTEELLVKAKISFTVDQVGRVTKASASSTAGDEQLATCLAEVTKAIQFPSPAQAPAGVVYPISFQPK